MLFVAPLLLASTLSLAGVQDPVYLATFDNEQQEIKTRISFHHALLSDERNGILLQLSNQDVLRLQSKGIKLTPADALWHSKVKKMQEQHVSQSVQTSGIPGFACYATVEETLASVEQLTQQYPDITQWVDIGDSWQKINGGSGYDLKVLKIGNKNLDNPPVLFIQSALHAREYATAGLTLDFAKMLLNDAKTNPDIAWILERHQIHILFQSNPDGRKIAEAGYLQRKNHNENHCPLGNVGVDLNRNYSFGWNTVEGGSSGQACQATYRGKSGASEPEVAAIEDYIRKLYPDVRGTNDDDAAPSDTQGLYLDIHSYSRLILWPWGNIDKPAPNQAGLESLGKKLAYFNNYLPQQSIGLYATDGTSDSLAYGELGIAHITFELGTDFFQSCDYYQETLKPDNLKALLYAAKVVEAPYLLTQGPDIESIEVVGSVGGDIEVKVSVTEERFSKLNGDLVADNIATVKYSLNEYPSAGNTRLATFLDGNADAKTENVIATFNQSDLIDGKITLYFQGKDITGQVGPVSAFNLDASLPTLRATATCEGAKCEFKAGNKFGGYSYLWQFADNSYNEEQFTAVMPQLGENKVTYQLTNKFGTTQSIEINAQVQELIKPEANFSEACEIYVCNFDAGLSSDLDGSQLTYEWTIDADVVSELGKFEHDFIQDGTYAVELKVTDEHGQTATKQSEVVFTANTTPPVVVAPKPDVTEPEAKNSGGLLNFLTLTLLGLFVLRRKKLKL